MKPKTGFLALQIVLLLGASSIDVRGEELQSPTAEDACALHERVRVKIQPAKKLISYFRWSDKKPEMTSAVFREIEAHTEYDPFTAELKLIDLTGSIFRDEWKLIEYEHYSEGMSYTSEKLFYETFPLRLLDLESREACKILTSYPTVREYFLEKVGDFDAKTAGVSQVSGRESKGLPSKEKAVSNQKSSKSVVSAEGQSH